MSVRLFNCFQRDAHAELLGETWPVGAAGQEGRPQKGAAVLLH